MTWPLNLAAAAAMLILPGLGLDLLLVPGAPGPLVRGVRAFLVSLAFWPLAIFATRAAPLSLRALALIGLGLGAALILLALARRRPWPSASRPSWGLLAAFAALTALHLVPLAFWTVAPGADMANHTMLARLIAEADRLPRSYRPLYPFENFESYAVGLPTTAAMLATVAGVPVHTASLAMALLSYAALTGGLFLLARRFAADAFALLASCATVALCDTYSFLWWGGNPTVLSLALGLAAIAPAMGPPLAGLRREGGMLFPLLAAGSALVHAIPPAALAYAVPVPALLWLAGTRPADRARLAAAWVVLLAMAAVLLGLTLLPGANLRVPPHVRDWVMDWQRRNSFRGDWKSFALTIWPWLNGRIRSGLFLTLLGGAVALAVRDRRHLPWLAWTAAVLVMLLNSQSWLLPGSILLYPERVAFLLLAPLAALLASALEELWRRARAWPAAWRGQVLGWTTAVAMAWPLAVGVHSVQGAGKEVAVTRNDLAAIRWLDANLPAGAVVANNYGDAGLWIPALAFRAVSHPHHVSLQYRSELQAFLRVQPPGYLFTGEKVVYSAVQYLPEEVEAAPGRYQLLHSDGNARLYRIADPGDPGPSVEGRSPSPR